MNVNSHNAIIARHFKLGFKKKDTRFILTTLGMYG